jgi:SAM-dependent methyltransferase
MTIAEQVDGRLKEAFNRLQNGARYFHDYRSHDFWIWANTKGILLDDGLRSVLAPFPPVTMMSAGSNDDSEQRFALSGADYYDHMERALNRFGRSWDDSETVMDFGCGVGRVARLFLRHATRQKFVGIDLTSVAIEWLSANMPFGEYHIGMVAPPLPLESRSLDVIFSVSVFTHLKATSQTAWLAEFRRLLKPGGIVFQTVHGTHAMNLCKRYVEWRNALHVSDDDFQFLSGSLNEQGFVWAPHSIQTTGTDDYGVSFQTEKYIQTEWTSGFELLGVWSGLIDGWQDLVALRKSDHERVLPVWPKSDIKRVESVVVEQTKGILQRGEPVRLTAKSSGGEDVHFKFYVSELSGCWRPLTGWLKEGFCEYVPWLPQKYGFIVHAASGKGMHSVPEAEAGISVIIK